jgi:lysophospholipase L1-like esterase
MGLREADELVSPVAASPRARRRWLFRATGLFFSLALAFAVGELMVRLRYGSVEPTSYFVPGIYAPESSPLHWSLIRSYSGVAVEQCERLSTHTNELGMRDPPLSAERAAAKPRVLFIGDSITFGGGVADGAPFPTLAQELWAPEHPGLATFNAGVPGYDTVQEYEMLKRVGPRVKPDLVIVTWYRNDVWVISDECGARVIDGYLVESEQALHDWKRRTLQHRHPIEWSALYRFVKIQWNNWLYPAKIKRAAEEFRGGRGAALEGIKRSEDALAGIRDWCRANGAKVLVVLSPAREESEADSVEEPRLIKTMAAFCQEQSIPCVSLQPAAHDHWTRTHETLFLICDRCHYGAKGHRWVAERIVEAAEPLLR